MEYIENAENFGFKQVEKKSHNWETIQYSAFIQIQSVLELYFIGSAIFLLNPVQNVDIKLSHFWCSNCQAPNIYDDIPATLHL